MSGDTIRVEVEVREGREGHSVLTFARHEAERRNPGWSAVAARYTGRRGPHGARLFEVDLDERTEP